MSVNEKMTAIADAIRGKTGKTEEMTLDQMVTEIEGIETGGGSGGGVYSGSMVFEAEDAVQGIQLNFGLPSRIKFLVMWFDREDFLAIEAPANNRLYSLIVLPVGLSDFIPVLRNTSVLHTNEYDRIFLVTSNVGANAESLNGYAINGLGAVQSGQYGEYLANDDGTITLQKWTSGSARMNIGKYNWIAVC